MVAQMKEAVRQVQAETAAKQPPASPPPEVPPREVKGKVKAALQRGLFGSDPK
jgi:hypothetical protein